MSWADTISYNDFVTAVKNAYGGSSSVTWSQVSQALAAGGCTTDNYLQYLEQYPAAVDIVKNANGSIRAARINPYSSIYSSASWGEASAAGSYNSNLVPATGTSQTLVSVPGNAITQSGSTSLSFKQGLNQAGNFVLKEVAPAVMAAGLGIKLGKAIDGAIYNIGTAMGLNPPWSLNPETWNSITSGSDDMASRLFNTIFGIDNNNQVQMYADESTIGLLAYWMGQQGFFSSGGSIIPPSDISVLFPSYTVGNIYCSNSSYKINSSGEKVGESVILSSSSPVYTGFLDNLDSCVQVFASLSPFTFTNSLNLFQNFSSKSVTVNGKTFYYSGAMLGMSKRDATAFVPEISFTYLRGDPFPYEIMWAYCVLFGTSGGSAPEGVTNQSGATIPDSSNWTSPEDAIEALRNLYPDWFTNPVTNDVVQPDGTVTTYYYYPIGFPEPDGSTGEQTQNDTEVNPETSTQTLIDYIIQILTNPNPQTDPETQTDPNTDPNNPTDTPTTPADPPDTGDGDTPIVPPIVGSASSLWRVYNPTQTEIDAFGAWLWSSNLVEQIKKLFSDPMQAIIGIHKVFAPPSIGGKATIKCGYIDSGVSSDYVSDQYSHVDCGTISLPEYFGSVFDYDPFTKVNLFLPFIGIVPLNVADVMRATISVKYHVDVITGACLAEVYVVRDGAGGILYTYAGSAIVSYPISSGSYAGIVAGILGIAGGIIGSVASGGSIAPALLGATYSASHLHTQVQKSGSFSGAPGAMGGKIPYLIVTRPQTRMAQNYSQYDGVGANYTTQLSACSGYVKVKEVHLKVPNAYESELKEIDNLLHSGILM